MPQFFVSPEALQRTPIIIRGAEARHIINVLRLRIGDWIVLCDGEGHRYRAVIAVIRPLQVRLTVQGELPVPPMPVEITLAAAVIRPERYEWLIEKVFELGCRRCIPLITGRTVEKYLPKRADERLARWRAIADGAAKQSGLPWRPEVTAIASLPDVLAQPWPTMYYCWEGLATATASSVVSRQSSVNAVTGDQRLATSDAVILIGPEGGFAPAEHAAILAKQPTPLSLGPLILRTETAACTAVTLVQQAFGYFDQNLGFEGFVASGSQQSSQTADDIIYGQKNRSD